MCLEELLKVLTDATELEFLENFANKYDDWKPEDVLSGMVDEFVSCIFHGYTSVLDI